MKKIDFEYIIKNIIIFNKTITPKQTFIYLLCFNILVIVIKFIIEFVNNIFMYYIK